MLGRQIQNTVFPPVLSPANGSSTDRLSTGTTTLGVVCKDCVILAADKRATAGNLIVNKNVEKVFPVTTHIGVTIAGNVSDIQLLTKHLSAELKLKEIRTHRESTVKEAANLLSAWTYNLIRTSYGITHFLVGGYDKAPAIYDVYPDGSVTEVEDYVTSGSGSLFALGVLESRYKKGITREEGIKMVVDALNASLARDTGSGNGFNVYVIDKNGAEKVLSKDVLTTA